MSRTPVELAAALIRGDHDAAVALSTAFVRARLIAAWRAEGVSEAEVKERDAAVAFPIAVAVVEAGTVPLNQHALRGAALELRRHLAEASEPAADAAYALAATEDVALFKDWIGLIERAADEQPGHVSHALALLGPSSDCC